MKSLVIDSIGKTAFRDVAADEPGPGAVAVTVRHVGLCGSDLNTFTGRNPMVSLPRIPGHEIGGVIRAAGAGVDAALAPGTPVVVIPYTTCTCPTCRQGRVNACQFNRTLGVQQDGALRPEIVVNADRLIPVSGLSSRALALVEPLSVGFHAVHRGRVTAADTVLVLGGGMIGVGAIIGAQARGARVIVSEPASRVKGPVLQSLGVHGVVTPGADTSPTGTPGAGASTTGTPGAGDLTAQLAALTEGAGVDVVIEAVGLPETFRAAVELAPFGGRVVYVGYARDEVEL